MGRLVAKGLTDFRAGRFAEAIAGVEKRDRGHTTGEPTALAILAMAQYRLGNEEQAGASLGAAQAWISSHMPKNEVFGGSWIDWLHCRILCREAEQLLNEPTTQNAKRPDVEN
jgi:hypothetical protein